MTDNSFRSRLASCGQSVKIGGNGFNLSIFLIIFFLIVLYILVGGLNRDETESGQIERSREKVTSSNDARRSAGSGGQKIRTDFPDWERCTVDRCVDGDTIVVRSRDLKERVRFIGVNAPESVKPNTPVEPYGKEASEYTRRRIEESGYVVYLKVDGDRTDQYGRRLALIYLDAKEQTLLNEELLERGLARYEPYYRYSASLKERFNRAQKHAQSEKMGIWGEFAKKPTASLPAKGSKTGLRPESGQPAATSPARR